MLSLLVATSLAGTHPAIDRFVADPPGVLDADGIHDAGFRVIVASNVAEGCAALHDEACVTAMADLALRESPWGGAPPDDPGDHGLYLAHLGIVLAAYREVTGDDRYDAAHGRIARAIARRTLAEPDRHLPSFAGVAARWPADQAAALYAVHRYDALHGTDLAEKPVAAWLEWMDAHGTDPETGLHRSEIAGATATGAYPRGCALSWTVAYASAFAPDRAQAWWTATQAHYGTSVAGMWGLREWPRGVDGPVDADSGPIVLSMGAAATALGIRAARSVGDEASARSYLRTVQAGMSAVSVAPSLRAQVDGILPAALLFSADNVR